MELDAQAASSIPRAVAAPSRITVLLGRLKPSMFDIVFAALLFWQFAAVPNPWQMLLFDGDTGWHIRTGEYVMATGTVPSHDMWSLTKNGQPWYAWEWGADVIMAVAFKAAGLKGVLLMTGVVLCLFPLILLRHMIWRGSTPLIALLLLFFCSSAAAIHYLARPHIFTMLLLPAALFLIDADQRKNTKWLWALVPLTVLWTNLHGGFVALLVSIFLITAGCAIGRKWDLVKRYVILGSLCGLVTVINPFGLQLHAHILEYLGADWIKNMVGEFHSPSFRSERMMQYELIMFIGLFAAASMWKRKRYGDVLMLVAWAHQSLISVRHVPIFVIIALPAVAESLTLAWTSVVEGLNRKHPLMILDNISTDLYANLRVPTAWLAVPVLVLVFLTPPSAWPTDFDKEKYPIGIMARNAELLSTSRLFTNDEWADYLLFKNYPRQRAFLDGRSDFYGEKLMEQYFQLIQGSFEWRSLMEKYKFDAVLVPPTSGLASLLKQDPNWKVLEDDGTAVLLVPKSKAANGTAQTATTEVPANVKNLAAGLMKFPRSAE